MAIDTRDKRASAFGTNIPALRIWPSPGGAQSFAFRRQCGYLYRGLVPSPERSACILANADVSPTLLGNADVALTILAEREEC